MSDDPILHTCTICGQRFKPSIGHCSGGRWGGCCSSFHTQHTADEHRIGPYEPNERRCLTVEERHERGWYQAEDGYWRSPADDRAAERAAARFRGSDAA